MYIPWSTLQRLVKPKACPWWALSNPRWTFPGQFFKGLSKPRSALGKPQLSLGLLNPRLARGEPWHSLQARQTQGSPLVSLDSLQVLILDKEPKCNIFSHHYTSLKVYVTRIELSYYTTWQLQPRQHLSRLGGTRQVYQLDISCRPWHILSTLTFFVDLDINTRPSRLCQDYQTLSSIIFPQSLGGLCNARIWRMTWHPLIHRNPNATRPD